LWVVCEGPDGAALGGERRYELVSHLLERGLAVACGPELAAEKLERKGPWLVLTRTFGHWPPAAASLANGPERQFLDISALEAAEIAEAALQFQKRFTPRPPQQKATWFPVIDYGRCTNCLQCLSFCLFGVYDVDDQQRLRVQHPENCKNNCPACARVCPEVAVVFPKHSASPINGAEVTEADLRQEKIKVDLSALLGGDVYTLLRQRSQRAKARFSKERNADQALQERQRCLAALGRLGDIPPEVLMSLPSPEEIQRRVEEAKARAQAAAAKEPTSRT
jgi:NAD-dependent dihydropyrimidine dehydrogenase PreA subunit